MISFRFWVSRCQKVDLAKWIALETLFFFFPVQCLRRYWPPKTILTQFQGPPSAYLLRGPKTVLFKVLHIIITPERMDS